MSGKLDQSLDEILSSRRKTSRRGGARVAKGGKVGGAVSAPAGGIKKSTKQVKSAAKAAPTGPTPTAKESKIVVSGLVSLPSLHVCNLN